MVVVAQQIYLNGSVDGDFIAAGKIISINCKVSDDVRIAGQALTLKDSAEIGDDLIASGFSLNCSSQSKVYGEVKFVGYQSVFAGHVEKKVNFASAKSKLSGRFGAEVEALLESDSYVLMSGWGVETPDIPDGLTVTETADIAGSLTYQSLSEADISTDASVGGEIEHLEVDDSERPPTLAERFISSVKQFFAVLLVGLLVTYFCPVWTGQVVNNVQRRPLASLAWGVVTLIVVATLGILLVVATISCHPPGICLPG